MSHADDGTGHAELVHQMEQVPGVVMPAWIVAEVGGVEHVGLTQVGAVGDVNGADREDRGRGTAAM